MVLEVEYATLLIYTQKLLLYKFMKDYDKNKESSYLKYCYIMKIKSSI